MESNNETSWDQIYQNNNIFSLLNPKIINNILAYDINQNIENFHVSFSFDHLLLRYTNNATGEEVEVSGRIVTKNVLEVHIPRLKKTYFDRLLPTIDIFTPEIKLAQSRFDVNKIDDTR